MHWARKVYTFDSLYGQKWKVITDLAYLKRMDFFFQKILIALLA